jgi:hypothetical protein
LQGREESLSNFKIDVHLFNLSNLLQALRLSMNLLAGLPGVNPSFNTLPSQPVSPENNKAHHFWWASCGLLGTGFELFGGFEGAPW